MTHHDHARARPTRGAPRQPRADDHPAGRHRSAAPLGPSHPGARPDAGRFRGARQLPPPARLPAGARAPGAGALRPGCAAEFRPAQHPLHHEHRHRRVGARQADALLAAHRQRRSVRVGLRLGRQASPAARALAAPGPLQGRHARACAARCIPMPACSRTAAEEIKSILRGRGRRRHAAGRRRHRAADDVRAAEGRHRGARRPAGHARRAPDQEPRRDHAAQHRRRDGRRRLPGHLRGAQARRARERDRRAGQQAPLRDGLRRRRGHQLRSPASAAARTRTTSPTA